MADPNTLQHLEKDGQKKHLSLVVINFMTFARFRIIAERYYRIAMRLWGWYMRIGSNSNGN